MMQIVEQTHEEKLAMYMKLPKKQLAEMLIYCNEFIERNEDETVDYKEFTLSSNELTANELMITNTGDTPIQLEQRFYIKL
jgi:hypothetical protein